MWPRVALLVSRQWHPILAADSSSIAGIPFWFRPSHGRKLLHFRTWGRVTIDHYHYGIDNISGNISRSNQHCYCHQSWYRLLTAVAGAQCGNIALKIPPPTTTAVMTSSLMLNRWKCAIWQRRLGPPTSLDASPMWIDIGGLNCR